MFYAGDGDEDLSWAINESFFHRDNRVDRSAPPLFKQAKKASFWWNDTKKKNNSIPDDHS